MKTLRTILATFGATSLLYGLFALIAMRVNPAFTGRSIYQLFRDTGFVALVIGIGCVLSFVIMTVALVSFRDDGTRKKREFLDDDADDDFLEEETVPEELAEEADESWSPEIKRKQRRALKHTDEEPTPDLFGDDADEDDSVSEDDSFEEEPAFERTEDADAAVPESREQPEAHYAEDTGIEGIFIRGEEPETTDAQPTKQCIYCGKTIDADSAFCNFCGKRV